MFDPGSAGWEVNDGLTVPAYVDDGCVDDGTRRQERHDDGDDDERDAQGEEEPQ